MIDAGLDESKSDSKLLVVSAIAGQTSLMKKFSRRWQNALDADNVAFFHAKEHWNKRAKSYHGLSTEKRKRLLEKLIGLIHKFGAFGVSICIDTVEYEQITSQRFRSQWGSPYAFAFQLLMIIASFDLVKRDRIHEYVNVLIECGHANTQQAYEILSKAVDKTDFWVRLKTCGLGGKVGNPILQAADLLAYGSCQQHSNPNEESEMYKKLVYDSPVPFITLPWNKSCIESITKDINGFIERRKAERRKFRETGEIILGSEYHKVQE
jgi:hypothetical protein